MEEIGIRVKHMNIIAHAQGYFYKTLGNVHYGSDPFSSKRFFALAMEKFEEALDTDPNNPDTLCNCLHADTPVTLASGISMKIKDLAALPDVRLPPPIPFRDS